jgi:hypothetical protein
MMNTWQPEQTAAASPAQPRRNQFYFGQLLTADHLQAEQRYGLDRQRLLTRLVDGPGVLCGLDLTVIRQGGSYGVEVAPGVAVDATGRVIVVRDVVQLLPLVPTDECGEPLVDGSLEPGRTYRISLCYAECATDFAPLEICGCGCGGAKHCQAGSVVESFGVRVQLDQPPFPVDLTCSWPVRRALQAGDVHGALALLLADCEAPAEDSCVVLGRLTVGPDGLPRAETLDVAVRQIVPTNVMLLQLIGCLASWLEECCGAGPTPTPVPPTPGPVSPTPTPSPPPVPPTPTPTPIPDRLAVSHVRFLRSDGDPRRLALPVVSSLTSPRDRPRFSFGRRVDVIEVGFGATPVDQKSIVAPDSFEVVRSQTGVVPGEIIHLPGNAVRFYRNDGFSTGTYRVILRGGPPGTDPPIRSQSGARLDGEPTAAWPTGDATEGGDYGFRFQVDP